ncbi:MAG TPA: hypothetical protein VNS34_10530 [Rhizobiaceae bacterium]|jgi:hypothetical protein|nr:hypothetical protein [Rhizobiaceae bacterium]
MTEIAHLLGLADAFIAATSVKEVTLSHRVFGDSKKLTAIRNGADITVGRFNAAIAWFSANWPEDADWPANVARPVVENAA